MANPDQPFGTPPDFRYRRGKTTSGNRAMDPGGHSMDHRALPSGHVQRAAHCRLHRPHLVPRESSGKSLRFLRALHTGNSIKLLAEHIPMNEKQRAERLILRRCGDVALGRQVREKSLDLGRPHRVRMAFSVEKNKAANPVNVARSVRML